VLTSRLQALWGTAVEVTAVRPLPGGASRESWDVRVRTAGAGRLPAAERRLIALERDDKSGGYVIRSPV